MVMSFSKELWQIWGATGLNWTEVKTTTNMDIPNDTIIRSVSTSTPVITQLLAQNPCVATG
jgi:hypothetical protein